MRAVPRLCKFYPGICLRTEEKEQKNISQGSRRVTVYIFITCYISLNYNTTSYYSTRRSNLTNASTRNFLGAFAKP